MMFPEELYRAVRAAPAPAPSPVVWTREEDKAFEKGLVIFPDDEPDRWRKIASVMVPAKTAQDCFDHYQVLLQDVIRIESGLVDYPDYENPPRISGRSCSNQISFGSRAKSEERKKGIPWTVEEHRRFLEGLEKYGKGDWRNISRQSVVTRNPTQVASHAQKYFLRLSTVGKREKKRNSIHDITNPSINE